MTAAQLAVGTGVVTAGAGMLATAGTYINDKRYGTTSSIFDYIGNSYTGSVMVGGSLVGLYLSLTGAEALTYLMTGGSMMVPVFGTVIYTKEIMAATMVTALWTSGANVLFQLEDLRMFLAGEKPLRAPTGNQRYDTAKAWAEMANHPVLQKIGMNLDDASNGVFLRTPTDDISTMSRHRGYHSTYNEFVKTQLDAMDINQSVEVLQNQVYDLQQSLKYLQQNGLPLYPSQGATVDLWQRSLERINKWMKK